MIFLSVSKLFVTFAFANYRLQKASLKFTMDHIITHSGTVERVEPSRVFVRIDQRSACSACKAASLCNASEHREKIVEIEDAHASQYEVGEKVVISTDMGTGYRAVALGFGIPLVVMLATIAIVKAATDNQGLAALIGLAVLAPYFLMIFVIREKLKRKFRFRIDSTLE